MQRDAPPPDYPAAPVGAGGQVGPAFIAYWGVIQRHKWGILGLVFACGLLGTLVALSLEPVYEAQATLLLDSKRAGFSPVQGEDASAWMSYYDSQTYLQTQIALLGSRALAEGVAERLQLWTHPEFDPRQEASRRARFQIGWPSLSSWLPLPEGPRDAPMSEAEVKKGVVDTVRGGVSAKALTDTEMVVVAYQAGDPELAARIANVYADAYIEMGLETRLQTVQKAAIWLTGRLDGLRGQVEASERKLQAYREEQGLVDMEGAMDLTDKELSEISERLVEARAKRTELENLSKQIGQIKNLSSAELSTGTLLLNNPIIQTLKSAEVDAERKISELAKRYGVEHPTMVAAQSDLRTVRDKLHAEVANAVAGVRKELDIARSRAAQLEREFDALKDNAQDVSRKEFVMRSLKREVETNQQLYDLFLTRFKETDLGADVESANARVIDTAQVPDVPIKPRKRRIVAATLLIALLIGVGLAFLLEQLDNTFKRGEDLEERLALTLLGTLPLLKGRRYKSTVPERVFSDNPTSDFAEAIRTIRTGVVLAGLDERRTLVLITSTTPEEGKTTVAANLAVALGHLEKVLLIDADMRRASVGSKFGLAPDAPGLSNLVAGTATPDECIHRIEDAGVDVMPAGFIPPNPLELLSSHRFAETIGRLGERYDRIVIDSAPAQAVSDALVLSKVCNAVVLVIKADATPAPLVQLAVRRLRQVGAPLVGAVLNQFDSDKAASYGHYGAHRKYLYSYGAYSPYDGDRGGR